ncbi:MAG: helix-turn-helix domain-containing protein, partial [Pseudonocardiaceae bacterium]
MTRPTPQGLQLAARLKALRVTKFRSGNQFAHHVGWPQPRVSKLETGAQRPSVEDIRIWVSAVGAGREVEAELLAMLAATRFMYVTHR